MLFKLSWNHNTLILGICQAIWLVLKHDMICFSLVPQNTKRIQEIPSAGKYLHSWNISWQKHFILAYSQTSIEYKCLDFHDVRIATCNRFHRGFFSIKYSWRIEFHCMSVSQAWNLLRFPFYRGSSNSLSS